MSSRRAVTHGASPRWAADCAIVLPTQLASPGSLTPEISMVSHSMGTPWQPSAPISSIWWRIFSAVESSRRRARTASGPPSPAQLGSIAASVVQPGVYGYVSRLMSAPAASASSSSASRSGALSLFTPKFMVAWAR